MDISFKITNTRWPLSNVPNAHAVCVFLLFVCLFFCLVLFLQMPSLNVPTDDSQVMKYRVFNFCRNLNVISWWHRDVSFAISQIASGLKRTIFGCISTENSPLRFDWQCWADRHFLLSHMEIFLVWLGLCSYDVSLDLLPRTMPILQALEFQGLGRLAVPNVEFPWQENTLNLPLNLRRTGSFNDQYSNSLAIAHLPHNIYRWAKNALKV